MGHRQVGTRSLHSDMCLPFVCHSKGTIQGIALDMLDRCSNQVLQYLVLLWPLEVE